MACQGRQAATVACCLATVAEAVMAPRDRLVALVATPACSATEAQVVPVAQALVEPTA